MKNVIIFFLNLQTSFAQNVGIVSNINLDLDYVHLEGTLKLRPKNQHKIDYNINEFINHYMEKKGFEVKYPYDFDFKLFPKNHNYKTPKQNEKLNEYVNLFCLENNLQKLIIIRKPTEIDMTEGVAGFFIYTSSLARKKAGIVYRTEIFLYDSSKGNNFSRFGSSRRIHNFKDYIFDKEGNIGKNNKVESNMIKVFEDFLIKYFEKILN